MRELLLAFFAITTSLWALPIAHAPLPALNVRLITPLTSYNSAAGSEFRCVVIAPYVLDGRLLIPQGAVVIGIVRQRKGVGLAVVRERASLKLEFREYELADGRRYPIEGVLRSLDNARESVTSKGQIQGILAANSPQSLLHGLWHRPRLMHFSRSFVGLTGAGGRVFNAYSLGPFGAAGVFAVRLVMFRLPEPEIQLPAGTEMKVSVQRLPPNAPSVAEPQLEPIPKETAEILTTLPAEVSKPGEEIAEDIINIAFEGSKEELNKAFSAAGWFEAVPLTTRTFARMYQSYTKQTGFPAAPVSKLLYQGAEPEMVYQKSLNTISKRHHIRLWRTQIGNREFWLGAATHDIGVKFKKSAMSFSHKIDRRIDLERSKVLNDLVFTGCAEKIRYVERPDVSTSNKPGASVLTDGRLAVLSLRDCEAPIVDQDTQAPAPPQSRIGRIARRMMLEGRQYALRGNAYYWAYRAVTFRRTAAAEARAFNQE